jgi:hypothetical protein
MAELAVWAVPNARLGRYELRINGLPARDGDFAAVYGDCGDGSTQFFRYKLYGSAGGRLRLVLRCRTQGVLEGIVFDGAFDMPAGADSYESEDVFFKL